MTPLLLRPFLLRTTNVIMIEPQQMNNQRHVIIPEAATFAPSSDTITVTSNYENVPASTNQASTSVQENKDNICVCNKVPKIILHRTHPPPFSIYKGSRHYHRNKPNRGDIDGASKVQHLSFLKPIANERHCKCCAKKVFILRKSRQP